MTTHQKPDISAQNRFICSICLNKRPANVFRNDEVNKRVAKSCPICQCGVIPMHTDLSDTAKADSRDKFKTKHVQTSQSDIPHSITLLNEVLNAFQTKKSLDAKAKIPITKDASVNTNAVKLIRKTNLSISETFHYTIEGSNKYNGEKFTILNFEPQVEKKISLSKHKSSSIPQMKLEELKHSLKEKTKSKDAIEEVNRMFATVRKLDDRNDSNRPLIRSGPRILPVVKTENYEEADAKMRQDYEMSSGDSGLKINTKHNRIDRCCRSESLPLYKY
ncbi:uncharacterized protein LOC119836365 [Zerene cesonia]|uniref:uncharacterized protein LOC119836365 n=1 Tax=Zerene cesonia TaxID=33412 RepID=UPI0018E5806F|nr:uncharacterized protein LOC119836365 [Zerene cesonia]